MPDDNDDLDPLGGDDDPTGGGGQADNFQKLRNQKDRSDKAAKDAQDEAAALRTENALLKAGIDTATTAGKIFAERLKGDPPESAQLAADYLAFKKELGIPETSSTDDAGNQHQQTDDAQQQQDNGTSDRQLLSTGGIPPTGTDPDARQTALKASQKAVREGAPFDVAAGGLINALANSRNRGEIPNLIGDGQRPKQT